MITKNTDPYKLKKCVACKKDIALGDRYFAYPLSLQQMCLPCAQKEIPKIIESLQKDLDKIIKEQQQQQQAG
ncbi:hypothetical protein [Nitrososphaera sp.]|uniref:hypothetical protein n=1 Tax=Nitrososphaera sp. TaxID=1971748 RepID=UPI00307F10BB